MITITDSAAAHLKNISGDNGKTVKLGVRGGGCAGFAYTWDLLEAEDIDKSDIQVAYPDGVLVVDSMSIMYLAGSQVDLKSDIFGTVLEVTTPAATSACGCGESINFDMDKVESNMANYTELKIPGK